MRGPGDLPPSQSSPVGVGWGERAPNIPVSSVSKQNPRGSQLPSGGWKLTFPPVLVPHRNVFPGPWFCSPVVLSAGAPGQLGSGSKERSGRCTHRRGWPDQTSCPTPASATDVSRVSAVQPQCHVLNISVIWDMENLSPICLSRHACASDFILPGKVCSASLSQQLWMLRDLSPVGSFLSIQRLW